MTPTTDWQEREQRVNEKRETDTLGALMIEREAKTTKMQFGLKEQMVGLQRELEKLDFNISAAELFLSTVIDNHKPTLNHHNVLCHNRSETMTKIRKLKERMKL